MEEKKAKIYAEIDKAANKRKAIGGRCADPELQKLIIDCLFDGLGYVTSIPRLIEAGYTRNNKCIVTKRQFEYVRESYFDIATMCIEMDKKLARFGQRHSSEVIEFLQELSKKYPEEFV